MRPLLLGSSTWKLQSPTINKDSANRIIDSRNAENSLMKVAVATGWVSEYGGGGGGQYMVTNLTINFPYLTM